MGKYEKESDSDSSEEEEFSFPTPEGLEDAPPGYTAPAAKALQQQARPPSGYRIPLGGTPAQPIPGIEQTRAAPFTDLDGRSPVFFGSAIMDGGQSVHPCKVAAHLEPPCRLGFAGAEQEHRGRFDLLPFVPEMMELVEASHGRIPPGRLPVKGGFEKSGEELYHGVAVTHGIKVPGKTGTHLGGCNIAFAGQEIVVTENYEILCWRD